MMEALPTVILYKLNRFDLWVARPFIKAKYITLVNLLADEELMPEYLTEHDVSDELCRWARTWLDDPVARARATANLAALRHRVARPGASQRAAGRIVQWLRTTMPLAIRARRRCIADHMTRLPARARLWNSLTWPNKTCDHRCWTRLRTFSSSRSKPAKSSD